MLRVDINTSTVSIHAPAGGATPSVETVSVYLLVSIHAPAGGATGAGAQLELLELVSIHAPAGGATSSLVCLILRQ